MVSELEKITRKRRKELDQVDSQARQDITAAYDKVINGITTDLRMLERDIEDARANGEDVNPDWLRRQFRYQRLIQQAAIEFDAFSDTAVQHLETARYKTVSGGAMLAYETLGSVGVSRDLFAGNINTQAFERLVSSLGFEPLQEIFDSFGDKESKLIQDGLIKGIGSGKGVAAITNDILKSFDQAFGARRIATIVRTESMRAYNASLAEQYAKVDHLIAGYRWVAAKSTRTCLACLGRHGKIYKTYQHNQHPNCRCICSPVAPDSEVPYQSGDDWLSKQSLEDQQKMFPTPDAFLSYREGKVDLGDFAGVRKDKKWGDSIYEKSWKSVADKKGLPYRTGDVGDVGELAATGTRKWGQGRHAPTFKNLDAAGEWENTQYQDWNRYLDNEQRQALTRYKGADSRIVNNYLRKRKDVILDIPKAQQMERAIHGAQRTFKRRGGTDQDVVVYRGVAPDVFGDILDGDLGDVVGTIINDKGFASTSLSEDYVLASRRHLGVIVETRIPKGSGAVSLEGEGVNTYGYDEHEVLLPKNSKLQIVGIEVDSEDGLIRLITEMIP